MSLKKQVRTWVVAGLAAGLAWGAGRAQEAGWPTYGGDAGGQRYSAAAQVNRANVSKLHPLWVYHTGALDPSQAAVRSASFEVTPVLFRGLLYVTTPFDDVIALDPQTGAEKWRFRPKIQGLHEGDLTVSRGVATWDGGGRGACAARVFVGTLDGQLIAVDALTGTPCEGFGKHGRVDMKAGLDEVDRGFHVTSAPTVVGSVIVTGSSISDNYAVDQARGTVRAFDVVTGRPAWTWEPLPWAATQKIRTGAGNAWSTIAADPELGLIYVPTGSASPDYFGGMRPGDGRDADSVVALEAKTGRKVWAFQVVHHNLWDYDVASEPLLFAWHGSTPAVAVTTKMGTVFVLDRRTGMPLFPVEERAVPKSDVPGEEASATQPYSSLPSLVRQTMAADVGGADRDESDAAFCREQLKSLRYDGLFTPPSLRGSLVYPGAVGGVNWGSAAYDPESGLLYANTNNLPYSAQLIARPVPQSWLRQSRGWIVLTLAFAVGVLLLFVLRRRRWVGLLLMGLSAAGMIAHWRQQHRAAPPPLSVAESTALAMRGAFGEDRSPQWRSPYSLFRHPILDHHGHSCAGTPWGTVAALNLQTGKMAWEQPHGTQIEGKTTGSLSLGGVMVTAGGLLFSAGTREPVFRAYDSATGQELWRGELPVPAQATPMTYEIGGRQFVVIAAGGHGLWGTKTGDAVIAFGVD